MFGVKREQPVEEPVVAAGDVTPLGIDEIRMLIKYAAQVCSTLQETIPGFGYTPASLKTLSDMITKERLRYGPTLMARFANMYGAFFGHVVLLSHHELRGIWVRGEKGIGVQVGSGDRKHVIYPVRRVFKHIEKGEDHSIFSLYAALCAKFDLDVANKASSHIAAPMTVIDFDAHDHDMYDTVMVTHGIAP